MAFLECAETTKTCEYAEKAIAFPVEDCGAGRLCRQPQAQALMHGAKIGARILTRLLMKLLLQHNTIPGQFLRPLVGDHAPARFKNR